MKPRCRRRARAVGALLVTVALVAGCTGDDDEGAPATTAGPTTPTTAARSAPDHTDGPGADPARLRRDRAGRGRGTEHRHPCGGSRGRRAARRRRRRRRARPVGSVHRRRGGDRAVRLAGRDDHPARWVSAPTSRSRRPSRWMRRQPTPPPSRSSAPSPKAPSGWPRSSPSRSTSRWSPSARSPSSRRPTFRRRSNRRSRDAGSGSARRRCASTRRPVTGCRWRPTTPSPCPPAPASASGAELGDAVRAVLLHPAGRRRRVLGRRARGPAAAAGVRRHVRPGHRRRGRPRPRHGDRRRRGARRPPRHRRRGRRRRGCPGRGRGRGRRARWWPSPRPNRWRPTRPST